MSSELIALAPATAKKIDMARSFSPELDLADSYAADRNAVAKRIFLPMEEMALAMPELPLDVKFELLKVLLLRMSFS